MTTKEWLSRAWNIEKKIRSFKIARNSLLNSYGSISTCKDKVQSTQNNSAEERCFRYMEYAERINEQIEEQNKIKDEILSSIGKVDDALLCTILIARYINFETWEKISQDINYGLRHTFRLHGRALKKIKDVIECHIDSVI